MKENNVVPRHVGVIMDGNGRWATKRLLPRAAGHSAGLRTVVNLANYAKDAGVEYLTVYALSTENLSRPKEEIEALFALFRKYFTEHLTALYQTGSRIRVIGDFSILPRDICELIENGEKNSPEDATFTLTIALNYGARSEIVTAVNEAVKKGQAVTEQSFDKLLYTGDMPALDLVIRTGGEKRLSNFLLWQSAYAELYFTDVYFPDFNKKQFDKALADYAGRNRRFGKV